MINMETLTATTIFWLLVLGATEGWVIGYIIGDEGITVRSNVVWGLIGAPVVGICGLYVEISGVLLFAFMGTLAILFLANVFHLHHVEDIKGDIDRGAKIVRKK
ncbi:hypothetical protein CK503_13430 [Aliifodinibius salipaludis]|uniref:Uncharacterized protein n=2 Tax=Fodinibius salipaludis TaxID=2032627 RepID=A0A2A2G8J0_9BACT|nr:hypothetical protein CK503_13430 [Aliifodinibius salipaludis]